MSESITNVLEYKGFKGTIEVEARENILFGHVQNLKDENDIVSYEGETVKQLREDFESAIDDYLAGFEDYVKDN